MVIKVQCPCGARFEFEVEPVHGRMPVPVACPSCGADGTSLANEQIQQKLAATPAAPPPAPVRIVLPPSAAPAPAPAAPAPSAAEKPRLGIRRAASMPPENPAAPPDAAASAPEQVLCPKHANEVAVERCYVCGKPICAKCMKLFGYVCSVFCRDKAAASGQVVPEYAFQKSVLDRKARNKGKMIAAAVTGLVLSLVSVWAWFVFAGSKPKVVYTQRIPSANEDRVYQLVSPEEYLFLDDKKLMLFNWKEGKEVWSVAAPAPAEGNDADGFSFSRFSGSAEILDAREDIWVKWSGRVTCYDRATGNRNHEIPLKGYVEHVSPGKEAIVIVSSPNRMTKVATRIALPDGTVTSDEINVVPPEMKKRSTKPEERSEVVQADTELLVAASPNVVGFELRMIEPIAVAHEAIKKKDKSALESGNLSAAGSLNAAQDLVNEMTRDATGGIEYEDVSRYQVTLRRHLAPGAAEWTGEVVGHVDFFPMRTVDLLVAGKSLRVFDKNNKKLWESPLTYPIRQDMATRVSTEDPPALETADTLYFYDKGVLTAFDLRTGAARWRVTSVGIWNIQVDDNGDLYVNTTTAGPEDIKYSQQFKAFDRAEPVLMKVNGKSGKVLWQTKLIAEECLLTGKFVYAYRHGASGGGGFLMGGGGSEVTFEMHRLKPGSGKRAWSYIPTRTPYRVDAHRNYIVLDCGNELQILKYLTF